MPTYDYECQKCKEVFEKFQKITDKPLETCPKCRGKLKRLIGKGSGIIFKGGGFYSTDYRSPDYKKKSKAEHSSPSSSSCPKSCEGCGKK
ncbi:MAG: FmdB family zinc ribbon protein [bacterium]